MSDIENDESVLPFVIKKRGGVGGLNAARLAVAGSAPQRNVGAGSQFVGGHTG